MLSWFVTRSFKMALSAVTAHSTYMLLSDIWFAPVGWCYLPEWLALGRWCVRFSWLTPRTRYSLGRWLLSEYGAHSGDGSLVPIGALNGNDSPFMFGTLLVVGSLVLAVLSSSWLLVLLRCSQARRLDQGFMVLSGWVSALLVWCFHLAGSIPFCGALGDDDSLF
jgi:hypothetical protein